MEFWLGWWTFFIGGLHDNSSSSTHAMVERRAVLVCILHIPGSDFFCRLGIIRSLIFISVYNCWYSTSSKSNTSYSYARSKLFLCYVFTLSLVTHTNCKCVKVVTGCTTILSWVSVILPIMFGIIHFCFGMSLSWSCSCCRVVWVSCLHTCRTLTVQNHFKFFNQMDLNSHFIIIMTSS